MFRFREPSCWDDIWSKFPEARDTISHREYARALRDNVACSSIRSTAARHLVRRAHPPHRVWRCLNITAVRQAGEALRSSEERSGCSPRPPTTPSGTGTVTDALWWNKSFETLFDCRQRISIQRSSRGPIPSIGRSGAVVTSSRHSVRGDSWTRAMRFDVWTAATPMCWTADTSSVMATARPCE